MKTATNTLTINGARPGPRLAVEGPEPLTSSVISALSRLPSLVYLRGTLDISSSNVSGEADYQLSLKRTQTTLASVQTVLAHATVLGMIQGRGVSRTAIEAAMQDQVPSQRAA